MANRHTAIVYPENHVWEPHTIYRAKVSWFNGNPLHEVLLFSGFLSDGIPSGYHEAWIPGQGTISDFMYYKRPVIHIIEKVYKTNFGGMECLLKS